MKITLFLYICNMSTFGKKALLNWDYNSDDRKRFSKTNKNIQLEILKKWYPIGEVFYSKNVNEEFIISGYKEYMGFYMVCSASNGLWTHPLNLKEPKWMERDRNIEKLLK
jgi:hypothetical protein